MPVIVIGADTPLGRPIVAALLRRDGEVRVFVSDPGAAEELRSRGARVALGDVSDASHVGGAAIDAFCAVAVLDCVVDARERAFAAGGGVVAGWGSALAEAGVSRVIVVPDSGGAIDPAPLLAACPEQAVVPTAGRASGEVAAEIARLDGLAELPNPPAPA